MRKFIFGLDVAWRLGIGITMLWMGFFNRLCLDAQAFLWDMHIVGRRHSLLDVLPLYSNSIV